MVPALPHLRRCTPAARRGGSLNKSRNGENRAARRRAPRQPAGVGVSTPVWGRRRCRRARAPRQPAGVGVSTPQDRRSRQSPPGCTPAARRGGSLNGGRKGLVVAEQLVHPGSPPGWESQPISALPARTTAYRAPRQPAGVGVSTCSPRSCRKTGRSCTPAARRGGSLNRSSPSCWTRSTSCTPAARRGGSLNTRPYRVRPYCGLCTPAARRGGSLNTTAGLVAVAVPSAPRQPAGVGVSTA